MYTFFVRILWAWHLQTTPLFRSNLDPTNLVFMLQIEWLGVYCLRLCPYAIRPSVCFSVNLPLTLDRILWPIQDVVRIFRMHIPYVKYLQTTSADHLLTLTLTHSTLTLWPRMTVGMVFHDRTLFLIQKCTSPSIVLSPYKSYTCMFWLIPFQ